MRSFLLSKIAIPLNLAFIALYLACVPVGPDGYAEYLPLAWFIAGLVEVTLLFPSARKGEEAFDARTRVRKSICRDPVHLMGILGFLFILFQTLNGPRKIAYNANHRLWEFTVGKIRDFPACVDQIGSVQGLFWVLLAITAILVIRNGIGKKGRMLLLKYFVAISAGLALCDLVAYAAGSGSVVKTGALPAPFFPFPDHITAGVYFYMNFCIGCSLYATELASAEESERTVSKWPARLLLIASALTLAGAIYSLSCLAIVAVAVALLAIGIYCSIFLTGKLDSAKRLRMVGVGIILAGAVAFLHFTAYPSNRIHERIAKITSGEWISESEAAEHNVLSKVATRMFKDNAIHGVGTWGFADKQCFDKYVDDDEWEFLPHEDDHYTNCGNDHLQFLAEYGILGFVILVAPFIFLAGTIIYRLIMEFRPRRKKMSDSTTSSEHESIPFMQRITPCAFALFFAVIPPFILSFKFSIFRFPLIALTWTVFLTTLSTFLRKPTK